MRPFSTTTAASATAGRPVPSTSWPLVMMVEPVAVCMARSSNGLQEVHQNAHHVAAVHPVDLMAHIREIDERAVRQLLEDRLGIRPRQHPSLRLIAAKQQHGTGDLREERVKIESLHQPPRKNWRVDVAIDIAQA